MDIRILRTGDEQAFSRIAPGVFDDPIDPEATRRFLADPWHHIVVAIDGGEMVGFISAVHYLHPDKPHPELWINEVSVADSHRQRGIARDMLREVQALARSLGCREAWVLTDRTNGAATSLYSGGGGRDQDTTMFTFDVW
jgi:ribosomal protein S18 acetylase RimI-like enzyme